MAVTLSSQGLTDRPGLSRVLTELRNETDRRCSPMWRGNSLREFATDHSCNPHHRLRWGLRGRLAPVPTKSIGAIPAVPVRKLRLGGNVRSRRIFPDFAIRVIPPSGQGGRAAAPVQAPHRTDDDGQKPRFVPTQELFKGRHFGKEIVVLCVRWYLEFQAVLSRPSRDGRTRHRPAAHHNSAVGTVLHSGIRKAMEPCPAPCCRFTDAA